MTTEPSYLGALQLGWPFRGVLNCGKGGGPHPGLGGALRGQFLEKYSAESPNQATLSPAGETRWGGAVLRASGVNQGI